MHSKNLIALIPARKGSERIKNKNVIKLDGHALLAYTIRAAINSKLFSKILVSTNSKKFAKISEKYGAEVPFLRPDNISTSHSSDFQWVNFTMKKLNKLGFFYSHYFILRPTSPFRTSSTIINAWNKFKKYKSVETLRAVEICGQHPGKMWINSKNFIKPLIRGKKNGQPFYNLQFKSLPRIFVQNASLEISKVQVLNLYKTITGKKIIPFYTKNFEGFDINLPYDLKYAKFLIKNKKIKKERI